jgi:hypothetical protein
MPLASSGYIRMGGTDTDRSVNIQLGRAATATISFGEAAVRTLTGRSTGSVILPNDFWGKPAGFTTVSLATLPSNSFAFFTGDFTIECRLVLISDGVWEVLANNDSLNSGAWGTPTNSGAGANYWVRFTRTGYSPINEPEKSTATTGWLNLGLDQSVSVYTYFDDISGSQAQYTIQIATDSGGANIIATRTGVQLFAVPGSPP